MHARVRAHNHLIVCSYHGPSCHLALWPSVFQVDLAIRQLQERKAATTGGTQTCAQLSVADLAAEGLRLRSEMARAAEEER